MGACLSVINELIFSNTSKYTSTDTKKGVLSVEGCNNDFPSGVEKTEQSSVEAEVENEVACDDNDVSSTSGEDHELLDLAEVGCLREDVQVSIRWSCGELIGAGAFGRVYMGMNLESGELMAVKQVSLQDCETSRREDHVRALENEVGVLKRLRHINIVRYLGTERTNESLNIFLEYVPGGSIHSLLVKFGSFGESVVRRYTRQILSGLHFLHKNRIVHRDIKGANILVDNTGVVKLADFGASKQIANLVTLDDNIKSIKGTPFWMAPEVIKQTGHGRQADVWSVGCTVIEMATGKAPWSQFTNQVSVMFHIASSKTPPPIPEHLSADAKDFVKACLQRNPRDRATSSKLLEYRWMKEAHVMKHVHVTHDKEEIVRVESTSSSTVRLPMNSNANNQNRSKLMQQCPDVNDRGNNNNEYTPKQQPAIFETVSGDGESFVFGLSPIVSHSNRYVNHQTPQESGNSAHSVDMDQIEYSIDSSRITKSNDTTSDIIMGNKETTTTDANRTPTSRAMDESSMILNFVKEKAEGDCERLAPKNPDGSPLVLSVSPKTNRADSRGQTKESDDVHEDNKEKENEHPEDSGNLRLSREKVWEEELRRELEAERQQLSMRQ